MTSENRSDDTSLLYSGKCNLVTPATIGLVAGALPSIRNASGVCRAP